MFQPTDVLTLRLTIAECNQIMAVLGEQKYSFVVNIINKINEQATMQHNAALQPPHPRADGSAELRQE
jgi:hypothetical protein